MLLCLSFMHYLTGHILTELNVTVIPDYTPSPGDALGDVSKNRFTAGTVLRLTCVVLGASGSLTYSWSVQGNPPPPPGCTSCDPNTSNTATLRHLLYSFYAGTYTCTVSDSEQPSSEGSDSYTVTIVG